MKKICQKIRSWESVHEAFYYAMRASEVESLRSLIMYGAVYHFGPSWPLKVTVSDVPTANIDAAIIKVRTEVDRGNQVKVADVRTKSRSFTEIFTFQPEKADVTVLVSPPTPRISEADFAKLKVQIEERESSCGEMLLEKIRNFVPTN